MDNISFWYIAIVILIAIIIAVYGVMTNKVKMWLEYAVLVAEAQLGTGTGQAKLRMVYDMFIEKFPGFSAIVPFAIFSKWVDIALEWLEIQLKNNVSIRNIINGQKMD